LQWLRVGADFSVMAADTRRQTKAAHSMTSCAARSTVRGWHAGAIDVRRDDLLAPGDQSGADRRQYRALGRRWR